MIAGVNNPNEKISLLNGVVQKISTSPHTLVTDANMEMAIFLFGQ